MLLSPKEYLYRFGKGASKSLGQHFLIQPRTARRIVEALEITPGDIVVEIGPGLGALTRYLIDYPCDLYLVEIDKNLAEALQTLIFPCKASVRWYLQDILTIDWREFLKGSDGKEISKAPPSLKVIGNIPYNISSPLLFHLISARAIIERAVLMVQREVGLRWTARVGTKDYGIPTVILKNCVIAERLFSVSHGQFFPPPKVESIVVRLRFFDPPGWAPLSYEFFHNFVAEVFRQRRKTIMNGLKSFVMKNRTYAYKPDLIQGCLERANILPHLRPEEISPEGFVRLAKCFAEIGIPE
ncbi:MAG: 16S rRNA (adenine(1518)-N(6)/adenine(1519)-N(6))-dimethyltransferase RsmA [Syntrophobacterales bacterium]|nr:16S rRNA (adenine(1518)-N(6)/adenine(1519)-N(6))-dimethyltransferase RsmA [Syntrophobacterales bacterium]